MNKRTRACAITPKVKKAVEKRDGECCIFCGKRGKGDTEALDVAKEYINKGDMLLIFPEGTRNGLGKGLKMKKICFSLYKKVSFRF